MEGGRIIPLAQLKNELLFVVIFYNYFPTTPQPKVVRKKQLILLWLFVDFNL